MWYSHLALLASCGGFALVLIAISRKKKEYLHVLLALCGFVYALWALGWMMVFDGTQDWRHPGPEVDPALALVVVCMFLFPLFTAAILLQSSGVPHKIQAFIMAPFLVVSLVTILDSFKQGLVWSDFKAIPMAGIHDSPSPVLLWSAFVAFGILQIIALGLLVRTYCQAQDLKHRQQLRILGIQTLVGNSLYMVGSVLLDMFDQPPLAFLFILYPLGLYAWLAWRYHYLSPGVPLLDLGFVGQLRHCSAVLDKQFHLVQASKGAKELLGLQDGWAGISLPDILGHALQYPGAKIPWSEFVPARPDRDFTWSFEATRPARNLNCTLKPCMDRFGDLAAWLLEFEISRDIRGNARTWGLSDRETDVAMLVMDGKGNKEIAQYMFISPATVRTHLYNIYQKTGASNRVGLGKILSGGHLEGKYD